MESAPLSIDHNRLGLAASRGHDALRASVIALQHCTLDSAVNVMNKNYLFSVSLSSDSAKIILAAVPTDSIRNHLTGPHCQFTEGPCIASDLTRSVRCKGAWQPVCLEHGSSLQMLPVLLPVQQQMEPDAWQLLTLIPR